MLHGGQAALPATPLPRTHARRPIQLSPAATQQPPSSRCCRRRTSPPRSAFAGCGIMPAPASSTSRGWKACSLRQGGKGRLQCVSAASMEHNHAMPCTRRGRGSACLPLANTISCHGAHRESTSPPGTVDAAAGLLLACGTGEGSAAPLAAWRDRCWCRRHSACGAEEGVAFQFRSAGGGVTPHPTCTLLCTLHTHLLAPVSAAPR